ncbi:pyridoxamine 5'-phosphate oxidase family protein [Nocardioides sp. TF02-7]|uniref:pyridoxamine 5'-phosphate oxidase family protein n=1 Tax=Nocardioides sp. TF02-7 TaxID=2917724 RepID=UPI001F06746F|nr:pyridoxamine 5'-phosphate oxidase family protein [Nocardioides sp. TF02-7]UMG91901.1 pyridoxamine 5'-phosphate oxidase family protein [Nocardioides sp. TF02-7]
MSESWFKSRVRDLDRDECLALLRAGDVGRIAFVDDSGPDILPVNYAVQGEDVLVTTSSYGVIARAATGARVAFEVDELDAFTRSGWSVVVRGPAERAAQFELSADLDERPSPWADGVRTYTIRIRPEVVTGRRLIPA